MKRKCKSCSHVVTDDRLVACPSCGGDLGHEGNSIPALSPDQEKHLLRSLWRRHWTFLFGGFSVLTVVSVVTLALSLSTAYKIGMQHVESNVVARVDLEFQQEAIRSTISSVASNQASELLISSIQPTIEDFKAETQDKLDDIYRFRDEVSTVTSNVIDIRDNLTTITQEIMSVLVPIQDATADTQLTQDFLLLTTRAQAYDRLSFTQLMSYAQGTSDYAVIAGAVVAAVSETLKLDRNSDYTETRSIKVGDIIYSGPWTSDEIADVLGIFGNRVIADMIRTSNNKHFLQYLIEMVDGESNLLALNRIMRAISTLSEKEWTHDDLPALHKWWATHSYQYTNWPIDEYKAGISAISSVKYEQALSNFVQVIAVDSTADKSRALAIASAVEIGDLYLATQLMQQFTDPNSPWSRWAGVKAQLVTGDVDSASTMLGTLYTNHPSLRKDAWIRQGNHLYRSVNWQLFNAQVTNSIEAFQNE